VILHGLAKADVLLTDEETVSRREFLWNAMLTEYDADNLSKYLTTKTITFSKEFLAFKGAWSHDEWNHYLGFRRIYSLLYDTPEDQIAKTLALDVGDFDPIADFLEDEFTTVLILAYDEIATFKSYVAEFPFYKSFGDARVFGWFKRVTNDELNHFRNCMNIIRRRHLGKIDEIPGTLKLFMAWDREKHPYGRTFVFDHYWYSQSYLEHCSELIRHYLASGLKDADFTGQIKTKEFEPLLKRYEYL
jgi:hypothetical protein